jgi:hypothetical protein
MLGCDCFSGTMANYDAEVLSSQAVAPILVGLVKRHAGAADRCVCLYSAAFAGGPPPGPGNPVLAIAHCVAASGVGTSVSTNCGGAPPPTFGALCGSCGGTVLCDGSCSVGTPSNLGAPCGSCGGAIRCDGTCSVATPRTFGVSCGSCGGTITCDESCSVATPPDLGQSCGQCGGVVQCGGCSVFSPVGVGGCCIMGPLHQCGAYLHCDGMCY